VTKIGLEIHCQLTKLESKLFCPCKADYRGLNQTQTSVRFVWEFQVRCHY